MPDLEKVTEKRFDISKWLRTLRMRNIATGWGLLILVGLLVGILASWIGWTFLSDVSANFVPDILAAGLALIVAEAIFGFRERQEQRAEDRRKVAEAQQKAHLLIAREMQKNADVLERTLFTLQGGAVPPPRTSVDKENWNLLVQSPLVIHLPVQHVWAAHESYYLSNDLLNELIDVMYRSAYSDREGLAKKYLPKFKEVLEETREAIDMLETAVKTD